MGQEKIELLTVAEYAKAKGCSVQYVYKLIKQGKLNQVEIVENGRKTKKIKVEQQQDLNQSFKPVENQFKPEDEKKTASTDAEYIKFLQEQLQKKDEQIERLTVLLDQQQKLSLNLQLQLTGTITTSAPEQEAVPEQNNTPEEQPKKTSWWHRLWYGE